MTIRQFLLAVCLLSLSILCVIYNPYKRVTETSLYKIIDKVDYHNRVSHFILICESTQDSLTYEFDVSVSTYRLHDVGDMVYLKRTKGGIFSSSEAFIYSFLTVIILWLSLSATLVFIITETIEYFTNKL